ncbi:unnamed protein product [Spirodela intermedia]|uniref:Uncharacterized protein n=1 Tax=Spirodela intermedia TaxID=51605 RepID=A0A7I8LG65_SPIIN|nr:unnamed protein product [Spirodela intermedia]
MASFTSSAAAASAPGARPLARERRATAQASSFGTTSHSPSLPRMRNSSASVRAVTVTSGSGITYGFK